MLFTCTDDSTLSTIDSDVTLHLNARQEAKTQSVWDLTGYTASKEV